MSVYLRCCLVLFSQIMCLRDTPNRHSLMTLLVAVGVNVVFLCIVGGQCIIAAVQKNTTEVIFMAFLGFI